MGDFKLDYTKLFHKIFHHQISLYINSKLLATYLQQEIHNTLQNCGTVIYTYTTSLGNIQFIFIYCFTAQVLNSECQPETSSGSLIIN